MLYPTEDFKVYGYISNTRIKFMLVLDEMLQKEDEMRMVRLDMLCFWKKLLQSCQVAQTCSKYLRWFPRMRGS